MAIATNEDSVTLATLFFVVSWFGSWIVNELAYAVFARGLLGQSLASVYDPYRCGSAQRLITMLEAIAAKGYIKSTMLNTRRCVLLGSGF